MTFSRLSHYFERIENISSRLAITEMLAYLFQETSEKEIGSVCYLLQGRVAPLYEPIEFGMGEKFVIRSIRVAYNVEDSHARKMFHEVGDLGSVADLLRQHSNENTANIDTEIIDVFQSLQAIAGTSGEGSQERKIALLSNLLRRLDHCSVRYVTRIVLGKLRLGFSDMTILDALSWMLCRDKSLREQLEKAYNVRSDIGYIASVAKIHGVEGLNEVHAVVGTPILSALCQRLSTADDMIEKMGEVSVEPKYDGVRAQVHYERQATRGLRQTAYGKQLTANSLRQTAYGKQLTADGERIAVFSRNLENTTAMFPELHTMGSWINGNEVIFDSEAVGVDLKTGAILPFQETTTRKRKHGIEEASKTVPIKFFVFDILYRDGQSLLDKPLSERRKILEDTIQPNPIMEISPYIITQDPSVLRSFHTEQLNKGLEGVVVKKWTSVYESGRRAYNWVKFKEEEGKSGKLRDTIDGVVMGYYYGEGKRSGFGIGAFLVGVQDNESFVSITKIGTGVSDDQWKALIQRFHAIQVSEKPTEYGDVDPTIVPDVWLEPKIVVEISGDDLTKSPTHGAGYAVRFPRLVRVRDDKSPRDATTMNEIRSMVD